MLGIGGGGVVVDQEEDLWGNFQGDRIVFCDIGVVDK